MKDGKRWASHGKESLCFGTIAEKALAYRRCPWAGGSTQGRPSPDDLTSWAASGEKRWSFTDPKHGLSRL